MVVPIRHRAARNGDEAGLLGTGERLAIAGLPLLAEHCIDAALGEARAHAHRGVAANIEGAAHLSEAPAFREFEQNLGAGAARVDAGVQARAVGRGERDLIAWIHGCRLGREHCSHHAHLLWCS